MVAYLVSESFDELLRFLTRQFLIISYILLFSEFQLSFYCSNNNCKIMESSSNINSSYPGSDSNVNKQSLKRNYISTRKTQRAVCVPVPLHFAPLNPFKHSHVNSRELMSRHCPPFWQGFAAQGFAVELMVVQLNTINQERS